MLQVETLPPSFVALLAALRPCFTAPSFHTFVTLVAGMIAVPGRRTVTAAWVAAGQAGIRHHARAFWFLGRARWSVEEVGEVLTRLVAGLLLDPHEAVLVAVDDTLVRRSGRRVHAAFWHHDGAAKGPRRVTAWGNNWVIAAIVVRLPFRTRPMAVPVGFALWQPNGPTKQVLCCQLVARIAAALPGRRIHVVADCAYAGADGAQGAALGANRDRGLPAGVTLTSRLRANAKLHAIYDNTGRPRRGGRPRTIGAVLGCPKDLAAATTAAGGWATVTVTRYGTTATVQVLDRSCLWYGAYRSRPMRVILVRDSTGDRARPTKAGYELALITTDLTAPTETIITRYADRWPIETMIEDAKQHTGLGQTRTRTPGAVQRAVPLTLTAHTLTVLWYARHGHDPADITDRQHTTPWYRTKTEPAYQDMIIKLRRTLIAARFHPGTARNPTPEETLAVHTAWANAAA